MSTAAGSTSSANGPSDSPVINGEGLFLAYRSFATNILSGITASPALYVFSDSTGSNSLLSLGQPVSGWISWIATPSISADGGTVSFQSWTPGWVAGDLNRSGDVFAGMVDSDSDGIPDWWMLQYFEHPTGLAGDHSRAEDDSDGDGMTNLEEYLAGTIPTDPTSVFRIQVSFVAATNGVVLSWPASASRNYRVQYKSDLRESVWLDSSGPVSVIGNQGYFAGPADQVGGYYRVVASH